MNQLSKKNIEEAENLDGPTKDLKAYKDKLKEHYESLLKLSNEQILSELGNLKNDNLDMKSNDDEDVEIQIKPNDNNNLNEIIVVDLLFILRHKYRNIFNDTLHNYTEIVNMQIMEELKKIENISLNGNSQIQKISNEKNDYKGIIAPKLNGNKNIKCSIYFKIFDELKIIFQ